MICHPSFHPFSTLFPDWPIITHSRPAEFLLPLFGYVMLFKECVGCMIESTVVLPEVMLKCLSSSSNFCETGQVGLEQ